LLINYTQSKISKSVKEQQLHHVNLVIYYSCLRLQLVPEGIAHIDREDPDWMTQDSGRVIRNY